MKKKPTKNRLKNISPEEATRLLEAGQIRVVNTKPEDKKWDCCPKCFREGEVVITCGCPCHTEPRQEWELEYSKRFGLCEHEKAKCPCRKELVFIRKLLAQERERVVEMIEKELKEWEKNDDLKVPQKLAIESALSDLLALIKKQQL